MRKGLCAEKDKEKCLEDFGESGIAWACENCNKLSWDEIGDYTKKLMQLAALQRGGYPFLANDLTVDEWVDLGRVREALQPAMTCPFMGTRKG